MKKKKRIEAALNLIGDLGGNPGANQKQWCLDQVVRILSGDGYDEWVCRQKDGEDGPETYDWDVGVAP